MECLLRKRKAFEPNEWKFMPAFSIAWHFCILFCRSQVDLDFFFLSEATTSGDVEQRRVWYSNDVINYCFESIPKAKHWHSARGRSENSSTARTPTTGCVATAARRLRKPPNFYPGNTGKIPKSVTQAELTDSGATGVATVAAFVAIPATWKLINFSKGFWAAAETLFARFPSPSWLNRNVHEVNFVFGSTANLPTHGRRWSFIIIERVFRKLSERGLHFCRRKCFSCIFFARWLKESEHFMQQCN